MTTMGPHLATSPIMLFHAEIQASHAIQVFVVHPGFGCPLCLQGRAIVLRGEPSLLRSWSKGVYPPVVVVMEILQFRKHPGPIHYDLGLSPWACRLSVM